MSNTFPNFSKVTLESRELIESYTHKSKPFSDFNFYSLWCWDTSDKRAFSILNDNLVLLMTDYATEEPVLTFIGEHSLDETVATLLAYAKENSIAPTLRYIPSVVPEQLNTQKFNIEADRGDFDYVFSIDELCALRGNKYKSKRRLLKSFVKNFPNAKFEHFNITDPKVESIIFKVIERWRQKKEIDRKNYDLEHELMATKKLLTTNTEGALQVSAVFLDGSPIAYSVDERLPKKFLLSHFSKADNTFSGVYDFLNSHIAKQASCEGYKFWNWEQDLNEEGLRYAKLRYRPVEFLKKYKISLFD